jgi:hypothetical protein
MPAPYMPVYTPTLKARIALITTVLAAVFGTGIVLIALYDAHSDLHDALQDQQDSVVKLTANQLDTAMTDRIQLLSHQAAQLGGLLAQAHGAQAAAVRQRALDALSAAIPVPAAFNALLVADLQGNVASDPGGDAEISDRSYFREAARTLAPVVSPPIRSRTTGQMGVLVAVPVLSPQQTFAGLVGGWLDLSSANFLVDILHNRLGTTGYYCLVSAGRHRSTCAIPIPPRHASRRGPWAIPAARTTARRRWNSSRRRAR